jgi:hypothetical protein
LEKVSYFVNLKKYQFRLSDKYSHQLEKYNLVCHFCGNFLDADTANNKCYSNTTGNENKVKYTNENVPQENMNNLRHYFGTPAPDYYDKINQIVTTTHLNHQNFDERVHKEEADLQEIKNIADEERRMRKEREKVGDAKQDRYGLSGAERVFSHREKNNNHEIFNRNSNLDLKGIMEKIKYFSDLQKLDSEKLMEDFFSGRNNTSYEELKLLLMLTFKMPIN